MTQLNALAESKIAIDEIVALVCARFNISRGEIVASKISRRNSKYRFVVFAMMQKHTGMSCAEISRFFRIDHTSVLYGLTHYVQVMKQNDLWRADIAYIESTLDAGVERVVGEIAAMTRPKVIEKPKPKMVTVAPKSLWSKQTKTAEYRATIKPIECEPINNEPARENHRLLWHNYAEWKLRNPIEWFMHKSKSEAA